MGPALHLIAKVKWERDNDSADTEQLWEAWRHRHFLDADTFLIQRPPSGPRVTIWLSENKFCPPCRSLVVTQNPWKLIPNSRLCIRDRTGDHFTSRAPRDYWRQNGQRVASWHWFACMQESNKIKINESFCWAKVMEMSRLAHESFLLTNSRRWSIKSGGCHENMVQNPHENAPNKFRVQASHSIAGTAAHLRDYEGAGSSAPITMQRRCLFKQFDVVTPPR